MESSGERSAGARVLCVVGARPNFMKMAPVLAALRRRPGLEPLLVHTGQHYDAAMSRVFFDELNMPEPDVNLDVGSDTHARQTARILEKFDAILATGPPRLVVVAGDVNSTLACALAAAKRRIPLAHVEAGLRSRDRSMPEEINRVVTDVLSDLLFATSADAVENLIAEGIERSRIHLVGNSMIDTLERYLPQARARRAYESHGLAARGYAVVTLHRPSNVDDPDSLRRLLESLNALAERLPVLFPVHPRTEERIRLVGFRPARRLLLTKPFGYLEFLSVMDSARLVVTDSGGIQEETTALGVPCLTLRENTERPITISGGTNRLIGSDPGAILPAADQVLAAGETEAKRPPLWDGSAGERIAAVIAAALAEPDKIEVETGAGLA